MKILSLYEDEEVGTKTQVAMAACDDDCHDCDSDSDHSCDCFSLCF